MLSTAPLLEGRDGGGAWERWRMSEAVEEAKHQVVFSVPMILTNVAYYCIPLVSVMFAGHLGNLELAGSNLANSWATVTAIFIRICPRLLKQKQTKYRSIYHRQQKKHSPGGGDEAIT
ncbi:unnamed protein product [Spirodela intermedia]|uniref:Uncharacterized protein n=1 Tax=Spirodela intermedia TaxID=51605 RepID=A0A7I8L8G5_SPIIN|nr:unnamed protein product [Spirodela intermedia]